jgi:hypothetical protein
MKNFKNIVLLLVGLTIFAVALSRPASSLAAAAKNANPKNNSSNGNGNGGGSNAATTSAATYNTDAVVIPANDGKWHTVLDTSIKNPTADDDLFIGVSQVTTITTTNVTSTSSTPNVISSGNAKLMMRVLVDGVEARPGPIVFDERLMTLTSSLQSFLSLSCTATPTTQTIITTSCVCNPTLAGLPVISCDPTLAVPSNYTRTCTSQTFTDNDVVTTCNLVNGANQSVTALLGQTIGHSFNFIAPGIGGMGQTHTIQVQEMLTQATANGGTAQALIGPGTLNVNAVNLKNK